MSHWMEGDWPENAEAESEQDRLLKKASKLIRELSKHQPAVSLRVDEFIGELECLADDIDGLFENDDPRSMGLVGDDGLP